MIVHVHYLYGSDVPHQYMLWTHTDKTEGEEENTAESSQTPSGVWGWQCN